MADSFVLPLPVNNTSYVKDSGHHFQLPPLDGSLLLPEIYDWHLVHNPRHTVFTYESYPVGYTHLSYAEVVPAAHRAARYVALATQVNLDAVPDGESLPPVAVMATSDTITHFCTLLGMMIAGIPIIVMSPRNSPAAIAHLLQKTKAAHVLISVEPFLRQLIDAACEINTQKVNVSMMPKFEEIFRREPYLPLKHRRYLQHVPAVYTHSSGSTSLPKPIPWTHRLLLQSAVAPLFGAHNYCNELFACHSVSMSHGTGVHFLAWVAAAGMIMAAFSPSSPAQIPSAAATFEGFFNLDTDYLVTFPNFIEGWALEDEKVEALKEVKGIIFVGGFLNTAVGDYLAEREVKLYPLFGLAEAGVVGSFLPPNQGRDWEYFTLTPHGGGEFVDAGDDLYELIIVRQRTKDLSLTVTNTKYKGADAYASNDLFAKHPQKPGYWRVIGRLDDRLIHSNGLKTDPVPMEHILGRDLRVQSAIVFGHGRSYNGALLEVRKQYEFDPDNIDALEEFRSYLRPRIDEANSIASAHSRIVPEMVIVTSPSKPFSYTEKGSIRRKLTLQSYNDEIERLYSAGGMTAHSKAVLPRSWTWSPENTLRFVRSTIHHVIPNIADTDNLFHHGCDSLQAAWTESTIRHALKDTRDKQAEAETTGPFVYDHPTIYQLNQFLSSIMAKGANDSNPVIDEKLDTITGFLSRFGSNFSQHASTTEGQSGNTKTAAETGAVVLITGTTGSLGANFLTQLATDDSIIHIFALNRAGESVSLADKQANALVERGFDRRILAFSKVTLLDGKLDAPGFGINSTVIEKMRKTVTHIIHLAWPVNWNIPLSYFEASLRGLYNLINFALSSSRIEPPRLLFASSIGVFRDVKAGDLIPEQPLQDLRVAVGQGYSESKAIAEKILEQAAQHTTLRPIIVRLGQVAGAMNGAWNSSEWFPALIKSSVTIGCLPIIPGIASWITADVAAQSFLQIRDSDTTIIHLSHPQPIHLSHILKHIGSDLNLPSIPYSQWLAMLELAGANTSWEKIIDLPALKMLDFFNRGNTGLTESSTEVLGLPCLEITKTLALAPALEVAPPIGEDDAKKWLAYWKRSGLL